MIESGVEELLIKLETKITQGKRAFMSELKQVDEGECLECISKIRDLLPTELSTARRISKDAQNITNSAKAQAQTIIQEAQLEAQRLVAEDKIVEEAKQEANNILQNAANYANSMIEQAYAQLAQLMDDAEQHSRQILQTVLETKASIFNQNMQPQDSDQQ